MSFLLLPRVTRRIRRNLHFNRVFQSVSEVLTPSQTLFSTLSLSLFSFGPIWSWYNQNTDICQEQTTIVVGIYIADYDRSLLLDLLGLLTIVVDFGSMDCDRSWLLDLQFMHDDRSPSRARGYDRSWLLHSYILTFMKLRIDLVLFSSFFINILPKWVRVWVCSNNDKYSMQTQYKQLIKGLNRVKIWDNEARIKFPHA